MGVSKSEMKIFHYDDPEFSWGKKKDGVYTDKKQWWGHIVTNCIGRTDVQYGRKYEAKGRWASWISKEDFQWYAKRCDHVRPVSDHQVTTFLDDMHNMTQPQLKRVISAASSLLE